MHAPHRAVQWVLDYLVIGLTISSVTTCKGSVVPGSKYVYYVVNEAGRGIGDHLCVFDACGNEVGYKPAIAYPGWDDWEWVNSTIECHRWAST